MSGGGIEIQSESIWGRRGEDCCAEDHSRTDYASSIIKHLACRDGVIRGDNGCADHGGRQAEAEIHLIRHVIHYEAGRNH